jgi:hypothetical protein
VENDIKLVGLIRKSTINIQGVAMLIAADASDMHGFDGQSKCSWVFPAIIQRLKPEGYRE